MVKNPYFQQNKGRLPTDPPNYLGTVAREIWRKIVPFLESTHKVLSYITRKFSQFFYRVSILSYAKVFAIIELFKDSCFSVSITNSKEKENNIMLTYDEFKEAMDKGFIKGDTVQIVRKNGKIHDYVLDGEQVEPHETLSLEKVSDIIKELGENN